MLASWFKDVANESDIISAPHCCPLPRSDRATLVTITSRLNLRRPSPTLMSNKPKRNRMKWVLRLAGSLLCCELVRRKSHSIGNTDLVSAFQFASDPLGRERHATELVRAVVVLGIPYSMMNHHSLFLFVFQPIDDGNCHRDNHNRASSFMIPLSKSSIEQHQV